MVVFYIQLQILLVILEQEYLIIKKIIHSKEKKNGGNSVKKFLLSDKNTIDKFFYKKFKNFAGGAMVVYGIDIVNKFNRLVIYDAQYVHGW